jgi:UDP-glucose 4-epimerase
MVNVVVTGGVGYVGRELVRQLLMVEPAANLHVIDNLDSGSHRLDAMATQSFALHNIDIRDSEAVRSTLASIKPDVVYHLAAVHFIPQCEKDPGAAVSRNVAGTVNLLDAVPDGTRFVVASTAAVYAPEATAHQEDASLTLPMDIYGWTKFQAEQYVRYYHQSGRVSGAIVRLFNVVGSGETNPHLAPAIIEQLDDGNRTIKLGNLFPHRDYIDVRDAAEGFRRLAAAENANGEVTLSNLGTGVTHSVGDMVQSIADAAGIEIRIEQDESRVRAVDRPMLQASTARLEKLTGWKPQIPLATAMQSAWASRKEDRLG